MNKTSMLSHLNIQNSDINDVLIIGSGPAGYSAGLYAVRASLKSVLFTGLSQPGGQLTTTTSVENYLGLDEVQGFEMTELFRKHAEKYGIVRIEADIVSITRHDSEPYFIAIDHQGKTYLSRTIIIATGAQAKRLHLPSEEKWWNRGISACAVCDGALPMFRKKVVAVVGGGDTACEEALFLSRFASEVIIIHRGDTLRASSIMQTRVKTQKNIRLLYHTRVVDVMGSAESKLLCGLQCEDLTSHLVYSMPVAGLFYAIGHTPNSSFLKTSNVQIDIDEQGYIKTQKGSTHTSCPGIFACGDVQDKIYRQAITSAGTGCMAALDAVHFLNNQEK